MISFAATPQAKEAQQARRYTDPSAGAPPSRRSGSNAPYVDRDHWNKVFTDQTYFDSIAKQKGMTEGAKVSLHGDDYVYRQAMIGYLSATRNVPLDDMRSIFDAEKDGFAKKVLGKQSASAREMFDWQKTQFERSNEKKAAADQILQNVIRRSLEDALSGGDTPFVESVGKDIDAASEMFDDEEKSRLWEKAEELDIKIRASQDRFAPEARFIFDALQQSTGQKTGFGAPDMREMAARFAQLPDAQRQAIYELAGGFAQLNQTDKGFWYQLAESLGRGGAAFTEAIPRNFREQTLRGQLRLLESDQPVFRAAGVGGAEFSAAGSTPITPEEREEAKAKIQADLGVLMVERELRDLAERVVDPIQTVTFLPEWIEEGLYGAARSIPYTAVAAVPIAGVPAVASALFSSNYDRIMLEYRGIDPDKAALIAAISAPIEAGLERMKVNTITGRLPVVGGLVKRLQHPNQRNLTRIMIGAGGIVVEQNIQETIQELTFPVVQTIAAALDADMPDYDWQERMANYPRELAVQFVALLPLSLMGVGALSYREIKRGENYLKSKAELEKMGYSPEQIDRITGAESAETAQAALVEEHGKRDPKLVKAAAQRIVDESIALREKANPAALPRLEKQGADYVVLSPEGKELARTTDQTAAEQALVSARRETVQREMRDVHTGINEAVAFIQKVNEARQRGEDVATIIREQAPRTLLTDYEANPTQENLDRLFETVRAFGQDINEPAELANFPVIGSNQGALAEGIWRSVIRINEGADGTIVMREFAQDNLKRAIAEGRVTMDFVRQQLNEILPQIDSDRMERRLRTETDTDVIEAFSDIAVAYFRGSVREEQIPAGLRGIMRRLAIATRDIFRRAYNLARLRAEGKLDRDFEALLAEAVGVDQQALVDRARERTEQEVGAQQNYSIGVSSQQDTDYLAAVERGDMETAQRMVDEAAKAAGYNVGPVWHSGSFSAQEDAEFVADRGVHFGTKRAAEERVRGKVLEDMALDAQVYEEDGRYYLDQDEWPAAPSSGWSDEDGARQWIAGEINDMDVDVDANFTSAYLKLQNPKRVSDQKLDWDGAIQKAKAEGHDGLVYRNQIEDKGNDSFVAFNANDIKSADPVTYDASGNVIPLSQRFDATTANINYSIGKPDKDGIVRESDDQTEAGTLAPDTDLTQLDPDQQQGEDWQDIPWEQTEKNYSIGPAVLPEAYPVLDQDLYEQILAETKTTAAIHIDRLRVGKYEGVDLQGGMYYPAIVANLQKGVVWAFNSKGVATAVAERARANGGYVKLVLMLEGNVIGNKTFAHIWFKQLRKNIKAGKITEADALAEMNAIRERYVTQSVKGQTKKFTGHDKAWTSLKQAKAAILAMPQIKRGASYFQKTSTVTKRDGEKIAYQSLLSQAMTAKGFPDAAKIVEAIEEPAFKGLPKGTIVGLIKIDPDAVPMTAAEAGVPEHLSYGFVLKGKPVARMAKFQTLDALFPNIAGRLMSQQATDFPAQQVLNYSIGSRAQPDVERNVVTLPDVTISGPANYSIAAWHGSPAEFDKFLLDYIGTGEGAQAWGWGLYFAERIQTAEEYRRGVSAMKQQRMTRVLLDGYDISHWLAGDLAIRHSLKRSTAEKLHDLVIRGIDSPIKIDGRNALKKELGDRLEIEITDNPKVEGSIYNVLLDVDSEELLDWDLPLPSQSQFVQSALQPLFDEFDANAGRGIYKEDRLRGVTIYNQIATNRNDDGGAIGEAEASKRLLSLGIKGIRYLDQGSRVSSKDMAKVAELRTEVAQLTETIARNEGKEWAERQMFTDWLASSSRDLEAMEKLIEVNKPTYNYVIFDESLIKILTRNGEQIGVEQAAQETSNYSISTQSEIDRVGAALNRLERGPLERVKIYEKAQEKFLRVMADNREMLAGMQDGDLAQMRRTQILQALGELDGIISVLPPEVRSKIGGYTQLAKVDPMDVFKGDQKVSEVRGMSGAIISAWMREGLNIGEAQKKTALPDGYRAERNLDPTRADRAIADVFIQRINRINEALEKFLRDEYNDAAVELFKRAKPQRSGAGEKPKGKLGADVHSLFDTLKEATEWTAEEAQAWADGQWARVESGELNPYEETHATLAAQMVTLFADWANADSTQRAAAVTMGLDVLNRAYKAEQQRIIAQRTKRGYDRADLSDDAGVSAEDDVARNQRAIKENSLWAKAEDVVLNLLNFEQVLSYVFGEDSKVARQLTNSQRRADNAKQDGINKLSEEWSDFTARLAGGRRAGETLVYQLSLPSAKLDDFTFSQNELIAITMMWMQPKGRQHMEGFLDSDGQPVGKWHYGQDFVNKAERLLTPEAKAVREYLLARYDAEYEAINKVYRKVYGLNLPKNQFYSPLVVESIKAPANMGIDPVTGAVFAAAANSPSALRSRGGAIAQPVFRDAVQTYLAHMMQMEHWKAYAEFNSEAAALLGHRDTRNVVKGKAGEQAATVVNGWLTYFNQGGNKEAASHLAITQLFNNMLGRASTMALFGRIGTLVIQSTQLGAAAAKMPVTAYMSRFAKLMSGQLEWGAALDSPYIQRRIAQMPPQVQVGMQGLRGDKPSVIREAARRVGWLISGMDGLFTAGTYAIVYDYQMSELAKGGITGAEAEKVAREEAERITDEIAQPTRAGARSLYELSASGPLARVAWAFSSEARKNLGLLIFSAMKRPKADLARAALYVMVFNGMLAAIIRSTIRDIRDGDDEELFDDKHWNPARLLGMLISEPLYGFPVVGEVFEKAVFSALGVYQPSGSLFEIQGAVPAVKRIPENLQSIVEGEADWRVIVRDANRMISAAGLFNGTIAGAATLSNLARDIFEATEASLSAE